MAKPWGRKTMRKGRARRGGAPTKQASTSLFGWAGIKDLLVKYDDAEKTEYADDFDNILAFAGLFSAVLTAFLVQMYPMLQVDNTDTTNQLLALVVKSQLGTTSTDISPAMNATVASLLYSPPFTPSTACRSINILFFLSLVFSLAAALFGILARQWLREYIKWNSPLSSPRENILVRQIRIEAWESWRVPATISAVPVLLEVAMILFLAGILILLWTLDDIVASAITVFIAMLVGKFFAFTVLPVVFKHCPYKSPTAWACIATFNAMGDLLIYCVRSCKMHLQALILGWSNRLDSLSLGSHMRGLLSLGVRPSAGPQDSAAWPFRSKSWRERDTEGCLATRIRANGRTHKHDEIRNAARLELAKELIPIAEDGTLTEDPMSVDIPEEAINTFLFDLAQSAYILRALSWVQRSSEDVRVDTYLDQCADFIHLDDPEDDLEVNGFRCNPAAVVNWCILWSFCTGNLSQPLLSLFPARQDATLIRGAAGISISNDDVVVERGDKIADLDLSPSGWHLIPTFARMVAADIRDAIHVSATSEWPHDVKRVVELFRMLRSLIADDLESHSTWYLDILESILSSDFFDRCAPGFRSEVFQVACELTKINLVLNEKRLTLSPGGTTSVEDYEFLLLEHLAFDFSSDSPNDDHLNMLVFCFTQRMKKASTDSDASGVIPQLLQQLRGVAEVISRKGVRRHTHTLQRELDALCITQLTFETESLSSQHGPLFREILHLFEDSYFQDTLVGGESMIRVGLHDNLEAAHRALEQCDYHGCAWISHHCSREIQQHYYEDCPLLTKESSLKLLGSTTHIDDDADAGSANLWVTASSSDITSGWNDVATCTYTEDGAAISGTERGDTAVPQDNVPEFRGTSGAAIAHAQCQQDTHFRRSGPDYGGDAAHIVCGSAPSSGPLPDNAPGPSTEHVLTSHTEDSAMDSASVVSRAATAPKAEQSAVSPQDLASRQGSRKSAHFVLDPVLQTPPASLPNDSAMSSWQGKSTESTVHHDGLVGKLTPSYASHQLLGLAQNDAWGHTAEIAGVVSPSGFSAEASATNPAGPNGMDIHLQERDDRAPVVPYAGFGVDIWEDGPRTLNGVPGHETPHHGQADELRASTPPLDIPGIPENNSDAKDRDFKLATSEKYNETVGRSTTSSRGDPTTGDAVNSGTLLSAIPSFRVHEIRTGGGGSADEQLREAAPTGWTSRSTVEVDHGSSTASSPDIQYASSLFPNHGAAHRNSLQSDFYGQNSVI